MKKIISKILIFIIVLSNISSSYADQIFGDSGTSINNNEVLDVLNNTTFEPQDRLGRLSYEFGIDKKYLTLANDLASQLEKRPTGLDITDIYNYLKEKNMPDKNGNVDFIQILNLVEMANPKVYYFRGGGKVKFKDNKVLITDYTLEAKEEIIKKSEQKIKDILKNMPKNIREGKDIQKVFYIYNVIIQNADYDTEESSYFLSNKKIKNQHSYNPYGILIDKKGVCESYAKAFNILMYELGIDSIRVSSEKMKHTWNKVKIDDLWYNIDLTYGDFVGIPNGFVSYEYFLKSDKKFEALGHEITDEKYAGAYDTSRDKNPFLDKALRLGFSKDGKLYTSNKAYLAPIYVNNKVYFSKISTNNKKIELTQYDLYNNNFPDETGVWIGD